MTTPATEWIERYKTRVEQALAQRLPAEDLHPATLHRAMRYAVLGGGKRIRPVLVYATGAAVGVSPEAIDAPACAVEYIHAYSLIHDDLPAMDNDDLRHGQPACHKVFGEAMAILAGDALQSLAFQVLSQDPTMIASPSIRLRMMALLAQASGSRGMAGGQAIDLEATGQALSLVELESMHIHKTGALIRASVLLGALSQSVVDAATLEQLDHYGKCIGLAFQVRDDILDVIGDAKTLGKKPGVDHALNKPTYPELLGLDGAREQLRTLHDEAQESLRDLGDEARLLRGIASYIVERMY